MKIISNILWSNLLVLSFLLLSSSLRAEDKVSNMGLVSYFPFDHNTKDLSTTVGGARSENHATWTGSPRYQKGLFGKAVTVGDSKGGHFLTTTSREYLFGKRSFTILYWVNLKANVKSDPVLVAGGGKNWKATGRTRGWVSAVTRDDVIANLSDGSIRTDVKKIDLDPDSYFHDNKFHWSLIALVVNREEESLISYVLDDNVKEIGDDESAPTSASISNLGDFTGKNKNIIIGQDGNGKGYKLPATGIDDLSVWNRALSRDEIQIIYSAGRKGKPLGKILTKKKVIVKTVKDTRKTDTSIHLNQGLLANYRFERGFEDSVSSSTNLDGVGVNGTQIVGNGVYGHCISLKDQFKQGVYVSNQPAINFGDKTDFTVSLWFKRWGGMNSDVPLGEARDGVLICKQDWSNGFSPGWGIYATPDGGVQWNIAGKKRKKVILISGDNAIANGYWHHVLISCSRSGSARCFIDGKMLKHVFISGIGNVNNLLPMSLGIDGKGEKSWKGNIDEVALWNRALNDAEAKKVFELNKKGISLNGTKTIKETITKKFRVTRKKVHGQTFPIIHYKSPSLKGDTISILEASSDGSNWVSGKAKFIPEGKPTKLSNGQIEYHFRYYQSTDAVAQGHVKFRVRIESRYRAPLSETLEPTAELRNGKAYLTWITSSPTSTVLNYTTDKNINHRYENNKLTKYHEVVLDMPPGRSFSYTVIQVDKNGAETCSNTSTVSSLWDYSPPPVVVQKHFNSTSHGVNWSARADEILALPNVIDRGYCLDYLCGDGRLAYELARKSQMVIIGVEDTQAKVDAARAFLVKRGVYGSRVSVMLVSDLHKLPFPKDFFNLIISQSQVKDRSSYAKLKSVVLRHTIPHRGVVAGLKGGVMKADPPKPVIPGTGVWTTAYGNPANTSSSTEEFSGKKSMSEFELRWLGSPGPELAWDRQTDEQPPLAINGRFYCQGKDRILALDSHNGCVLWSKELRDAQRFNLLRDAGNLTADNDAVWLALRKECWRMDGDTGKLTVFPLVNGPRSDLNYSWDYIARTGDVLLGSASVSEAYYKNHWTAKYWYTNLSGRLASQVVSDNLFSLNASTGEKNWEYHKGLIISVSITVGDGKVFFLETRNPSAVSGKVRRLGYSTWSKNLHLVCLNLETGKKIWDQNCRFSGGDFIVFLMYDAVSDRLILSSSDGRRNNLYAYNPADGELVWNQSPKYYKGDHGGKNQHPVLSNGEVLLTPNVFDAKTGKIKRSNIPLNKGQGCNTYWGSKNLLFFRTGYSGKGLSMWPTDASAPKSGIDQVKGACWLSWAPADGMLLIQEKSSGCSCGAWVHVSQGWGPKD